MNKTRLSNVVENNVEAGGEPLGHNRRKAGLFRKKSSSKVNFWGFLKILREFINFLEYFAETAETPTESAIRRSRRHRNGAGWAITRHSQTNRTELDNARDW
jgi:hypothetical protein